MECSARTRVGLKETFDEVLRITLELGPYTPGGEKVSAGAKAALLGGKIKAKAASKLEKMTAETGGCRPPGRGCLAANLTGWLVGWLAG
eukprot:SAG22_NODE_3715_length_1562_cov_1.202324_2_plen_89_part_00